MKFIFIFLSAVVLSSCQKHKPAPVVDLNDSRKTVRSSQPLVKQNKYHPNYVTVNKGDTLYSIGFSHDIDFRTLAEINHIPAPYRIYPGQKLRLKREKGALNNSSVVTHPVKIKKSTASNVKVTKTQKTTPKVVKPSIKVAAKPVKKVVATKPKVIKTVVAKPKSKPAVKPVVKPHIAPSSNSRWIWPVSGKVISTFSNSDVSRKGIDISSRVGTPVYASNNGTVVYSGDGLRGYGELVILKHANNLLSAYAHNSVRMVKEGQVVKQGQMIAKSGKGTDGRGLLHFEIRLNGQPVNPLKYLPK